MIVLRNWTKVNIVIIDYGLCNLLSVSNALRSLGASARVSSDPADLSRASAVILPGVGAFGDGMRGLKAKGFIEAIRDYVKTGRPFLGICLGMQMLFTKSYEFGEFDGLDLIPGEVRVFQNRMVNGGYEFKVPHIGWNGICSAGRSWQGTILHNILEGEDMYFVHSYRAVPANVDDVLSETSYANERFCSVIAKDNVVGCQFHPEKSADMGLRILKNFTGGD